MVLVQQGKLSLDESLERFLPDAPARWRSITVRELLNHTSGLPHDAPGENPFESRPPLDEDLAKWDVALAREVPLSSASKSAMWTATPKPTGAPFGYGFGWQIATRGGQRVVYHGGGRSGFKSYFARFPDKHLSFVVMTNAGQPAGSSGSFTETPR